MKRYKKAFPLYYLSDFKGCGFNKARKKKWQKRRELA